jgi:hypothetical protein
VRNRPSPSTRLQRGEMRRCWRRRIETRGLPTARRKFRGAILCPVTIGAGNRRCPTGLHQSGSFLNTKETASTFDNVSVNSKMAESTCESCGASADEPWETDAVRLAILRLSLEQPLHHKPKGWRILCDECEEGLQQFHPWYRSTKEGCQYPIK